MYINFEKSLEFGGVRVFLGGGGEGVVLVCLVLFLGSTERSVWTNREVN